jgi:uncharacterized spore protein YtfJ
MGRARTVPLAALPFAAGFSSSDSSEDSSLLSGFGGGGGTAAFFDPFVFYASLSAQVGKRN